MAGGCEEVVKGKQGCTYRVACKHQNLAAKEALTTSRVQRAEAASVTGRRQGALDYNVRKYALNAGQQHQDLNWSI